jgi:arylsulfatase A-like enzyme
VGKKAKQCSLGQAVIRRRPQTDPGASAHCAPEQATANRQPARRLGVRRRPEGSDLVIASGPSDTLAAAACSINCQSTRLHATYGVLRLKIALSIASLVVIYVTLVPLSDAAVRGADTPAAHPNILLIVADDLGYGELGCQGHNDIPTPHIDSIAKNGVRFTSGYVSCPVCSPTRAGLMTGRYQQRFGHEFNPGPVADAADNFGLVREEKTLAERLKAAGYATGLVGKWHLGTREGLRPTERGFDEFFGFLGGAHPYISNGRRRAEIMRGTERVAEPDYLTDAFQREAVAFIDRHKAQPFFLYLAFNAVHAPLQATTKYRERFPEVKDEKRQTFSAMLAAMDDAVGAVLAKVHDAGLDEKTLVFFISDNGGPTPQTTSRNDPLRGTKGTTWEGGIRIPFMIQWKGRVPSGKVDDRPVISLDIHPTALAAAGVTSQPEKKFDGVNLLPFLQGSRAEAPHEYLFWRFGPQMAVRKGDWKITRAAARGARQRRRRPARGNAEEQLYNLAQDIGENKDVAAEHADTVAELMSAWEKWNSELMAPRWQRANAQTRRNGKASP